MSNRLLLSSLVCCLLLGGSFLPAQDFRATISGQVTDPSKAPVPGAAVKALREGTNETKETRTNAEGIYTLPYLEPGPYLVEISAQGFTSAKRSVVVRVADKLNLSAQLQVSAVSESVTVTGEQELVDTQTASRGLNFDPIKVQEFPLNGRQSYMLMALSPGVLFTQQQFGSSGFSGTRGWDVNGSYTMNGGRTGTNQFLLNGAPISTDGTWQVAPNVEAIQEFKVMTNTYDSQYGRTGGGHVNTTVKSGTNSIHGSLFDFWRNTIFDANTTQNNQQGAGRGRRNQHQFGGTVGLPLRKDKDFLFFSFEGWREVVPFPVVSDSPPAMMRLGDGYTFFGQKIYDPLTSRLCVPGTDAPTCLAGGLYIRSPFKDNVIPAARISPVGKRILDLYPLPNQIGNPTVTQNFFATGSVGRYRYEQPMFRYDKVIGQKDRIYGLFYHQDGSEFRNQNGFAPPAQTGNIFSVRTQFGAVVDWTRVLSPTMVLDLRLSHARFWQNFPETSDVTFTWDKLGIKSIPTGPNATAKFAPRIQFTNTEYNNIIGGRTLNWSSRDQISIAPSLSMTRGKHGLKFGYEWALIQRGTKDEGRSNGLFTFGRFWTQQYSGRGTGTLDGSPIASMLLGLPDSGSIDFNDTFLRREPYMAFYVQDDWRVSPKLTLNLGLRYDFQYPLTEQHDRVNSGFDAKAKNPLSDQVLARWRQLKADWDKANPTNPYPAVPAELDGGLLFAGVNGQPHRTYDFDFTDIQPRAGIAWQFMKNTVFRAGFGIFHRTATQGNLTTGFNQSTLYQRSLDGDRTPSGGSTGAYSLENPFPGGLITPTGASLGLLTNIGRGLSVDGRQRVIPRTYQYSAGFERQLPWNIVMEASYVGSRTYHEALGINLSDMSLADYQKARANPNAYNLPVPNPFFGILPDRSDFGSGSTITVRNLLRRFPLFNGITYNTNPFGAVWYNALQVRLEKRAFSRSAGAVTWVLSYTFAKQMERFLRNNQNFETEKLISQLTDIDRPQQFSFSGVWDFPMGKGRRFLNTDNKFVNAVLGGWNYNWIFTYYAGVPTGKPDTVFTCGSYIVDDQSSTKWFNNNKSCYSQRPAFTFREVEQRFGNIRNPAYGPQLNMAVAKKFKLSERYEVEFRGESFNTANTPILDGPNTDFTNSRFGVLPIQQLNFPRQVQLGLRLKF